MIAKIAEFPRQLLQDIAPNSDQTLLITFSSSYLPSGISRTWPSCVLGRGRRYAGGTVLSPSPTAGASRLLPVYPGCGSNVSFFFSVSYSIRKGQLRSLVTVPSTFQSPQETQEGVKQLEHWTVEAKGPLVPARR